MNQKTFKIDQKIHWALVTKLEPNIQLRTKENELGHGSQSSCIVGRAPTT
jgi:hypothetical protein